MGFEIATTSVVCVTKSYRPVRLMAHLHDTIVVYDYSFWCIRFSRKSLQNQLQHSQANSK